MPERMACRLMFIACCLLPTLLVVAWTAAVHSPAYLRSQRRELEEQLAHQIGLEVRLESYRRRRDGSLKLGRIELTDTNGRPLLVAEDVSARLQGVRWVGTADRVVVHRKDFARLWEAVDHRWLRAVSLPGRQFRLAAQTVQLLYGDPARSSSFTDGETYEQVALELRAAEDLRSCQIGFSKKSPETLQTSPVECIVTEDAGQQVTHFKLLAQAGLPARLLSGDLVQFVGHDCIVYGQVHGVRQGGVWTTRVVETQLADVNFAQLAPSHLTFTGRGQIAIGQAQLIDGRLNVAEGLLTGVAGRVAPQTLQSLARYLEVEPAAHPDRPTLLDYGQLSVEFKLHSSGLDLKGNCPSGEHVIMVDQQGAPLLRSRAYWARRERVLRGLMMSAAEPDAVGRCAPYPIMAGVGATRR